MNQPSIIDGIFDKESFWWLVGYLQGDGTVDYRNGIWFISADYELIRSAMKAVKDCSGWTLASKLRPVNPPIDRS